MSRLRRTWLLYSVLHASYNSDVGSAFVLPMPHRSRYATGPTRGEITLPLSRAQRRSRCFGWGAPGSSCSERHLSWGTRVKMELAMGDGESAREGLARQEFKTLLADGNIKGCAQLVRQWGERLELSMADAEALLTAASNEPLRLENVEEENIILVYRVLKDAGFLRAFGSIDLDVIPTNTPGTMAETRLTELTGLDMKSLSPARRTGTWAFAGVALFGLQYLIGRAMGVDPLQTVIPLTLGLVVFDRVFIRGAVLGTIARAVVPGFKERIVKHEAGHFLLAYLMGCPVQGCVLDPFEIGKYGGGSAQGGTMFADPAFASAVARGKLTSSVINRFSIVLMGGIAAEAIHFGSSEGGSSDEGVLIQILSTINPPFNIIQIKNLALWAAVQAVLLIREHKDAYDELVVALERGAKLGECVGLLEKELGKRPLPGDVRRENLKAASPADEMRRMIVRRMAQQYAKNEQEQEQGVGSASASRAREGLAEAEADINRRMLQLQRKVEDLERGDAKGVTVENMGFKADSSGVWLNDLTALQETAPASAPASASASASASSLSTSTSKSTVSGARDGSMSADAPGSDEVMERERRLREIDMEAAENSRRIAELEERMRRLDKGEGDEKTE